MSFTTPCFIRKNTPELRKELEWLGYALSSLMHRDILITSPQMAWTISSNIGDSIEAIDCGTNEQLFLSIAALRDDTDESQWFIDGLNWHHCFVEKCSLKGFRKATVEELIHHFKEE